MTKKLDVDATKLFESMKYQIHVAIDYCHTLETEDVLWIEALGDVSIDERIQIEVKNYSDELTDGHENFWNTLNNWLKPDFNYKQFTSLILMTTQSFGERTSLDDWNDIAEAERLDKLRKILQRSETRLAEAKKRYEGKLSDKSQSEEEESRAPSVSKSLKLQRNILNNNSEETLLDVLSKIKLLTDQPNLNELIARYKKFYLKGIMPERQDDFIDDLFGFMTNASKITEGWRFEIGEFNRKIGELTYRYMISTPVFPQIDSNKIEDEVKKLRVNDRRFAVKLNEIGSDQEDILMAAVDLLHAQQYLVELIKDFTTSMEDIENYCEDERKRHYSCRKSAMYDCEPTFSREQLQRASCSFYHKRCGETVTIFGDYDSTPVAFRNGIYHMLAEEEPGGIRGEFHWRLWK